MAGHSKWSKIKRQKGANDAKRGKLFTKLGNAIAVAAKTGGDPTMNPTLALAIDKAKAANMPNANIEKSIKRGTGELGGDIIQELNFEGYGPGGIGVIVEAASDNRNRTTTEVRTAFSKNGGNLAETGAVAFQFTRKGSIRAKFTGDSDEAQLLAIDAGADDVVDEDGELVIYTDMKDLARVRDKLKSEGLEIIEAELVYAPNNVVEITEADTAKKVVKLMDAIEESEDVTNTYANFDINEELLDG
ncbi:MAG: YebC/PmpR family DNA-binding transcriptional regulator [Candidatus Saccharimonadales bacterium]|nr:YebC/PmpR family DNA-binding transcriptional regulator [Candidatus Saccharimonadales bacterium]